MLLTGLVGAWLVAGIGCSLMLLVYALILLFVLGQWNFYHDIVMHLMPSRKPVQPKVDVPPQESAVINEIC